MAFTCKYTVMCAAINAAYFFSTNKEEFIAEFFEATQADYERALADGTYGLYYEFITNHLSL